ncbi:MAG: phosphoribosylanthranilate isomerase [Acidobacteria bacterium]|nr:phosphoribosylanthranilate isomerase [Acidobacteriota bacterium]
MTRVKVCGITRLEDALMAAEEGASAIGFIFWPDSPRAVGPSDARAIARALPPRVSTIGVFVDQPLDDIRRIADTVQLSAIQLHGDESLSYAQAILQPVIKAVAITEAFAPERLDVYPPEVTVLLDAHDPVRRGGTGRTIDWSLAAAAAARRHVFLSGGLNPANIQEAVTRVRPYAVDLSSGVEASPGVKDPAKLRALFDALRRTPGYLTAESANNG